MSTALEQFPIRLRYYRVLRGWKQSDLARAAGLPQSSVSFFETSRRAPSVESLVRLADALGVTVDALLGRGVEAQGEMTPIAREVLGAADEGAGVEAGAVARLTRTAADAEARLSREEGVKRREREAAIRQEEEEAVSRYREAARLAAKDPVASELLALVLDRARRCFLFGLETAHRPELSSEGKASRAAHTREAARRAAVFDDLRRAVDAFEDRIAEVEVVAEGELLLVPRWVDRGRKRGWDRWVRRLFSALAVDVDGEEGYR